MMAARSSPPSAAAMARSISTRARNGYHEIGNSGRSIATSSPAISGLAACGPQHQARKRLPLGVDETGGLGPFRGLGASRALESRLSDLGRWGCDYPRNWV